MIPIRQPCNQFLISSHLARGPQWVRAIQLPGQLYPRERTSRDRPGWSVSCQNRKSVNPIRSPRRRGRAATVALQTERLGGVESLSRCEISITRARVASLSTSLSASARLVASRFASHSSNDRIIGAIDDFLEHLQHSLLLFMK
jgi:hypothetical protein